MEALKIILFAVVSAIAYGILHDQVTAHLCVEYFTIAHPPIFRTQSPFLLAIGWGIVATWWVGLPLGIALALAARLGSRPRFSLSRLRPMVLRLLAAMAACAAASGALAAYLVASGRMSVPGGWDRVIPPAKQVAFAADAWAHLASYTTGIVGGLLVVSWVVYLRLRQD